MDRERYFRLGETETKSSEAFEKKHRKCGAGKHDFTYCFTSGSLGDKITVRCNSCYEMKDITDIGSW